MRMPNPHRAVDIEKLRDYCLNPAHPRGRHKARHKARVFLASLGLTVNGAEQLRDSLLAAAYSEDVVPAEWDDYGQRYVVDFNLRGPAGEARVRSSWIVRQGEDFPRLTSCYVL